MSGNVVHVILFIRRKSSMVKTKLKEYIKRVLELESEVYMNNKLILAINEKIEMLTNESYTPYEEEYVYELYDEPKPIEFSSMEIFIVFTLTWLVGFVVGSIGKMIYVIVAEYGMTDADFGRILKFGAIFGICIGIVSIFIKAQKISKENKALIEETKIENNKIILQTDEINREIKERNKQIDEINKKKHIQVSAQIDYYKIQLKQLEELRNTTENTLCKYYEKDIIYPKYRDLIAVASFNDYLSSGVCETLEGHEGCYNKYDLEVRLDTIINKMDIVLQKIDEIKKNQHSLYSEIKKCTNKIDDLLCNMSNFESDMILNLKNIQTQNEISMATQKNCNEVLQYYAMENEKNVEYIKWLNTLNYYIN